MLAGPDQVQILTFNLIHHGIHFIKGHNTCHNVGPDHKRRYTVGKATVDHKIPGIRDHSRMQSCDITHEIIKSVSCHVSRRIQINPVKPLHNLCMIRNFKIRHYRLTKPLNLHIFTVILTDRHAGIDDIGDHHHPVIDLFRQLCLFLLQQCQFLGISGDLCFQCLGILFPALPHKRSDLFGIFLSQGTEIIRSLLSLAAFFIKSNNLIYHCQLTVLKLIFNILFHNIRVFPQKFNV